MNDSLKHANINLAILLFIFRRQKYLEMAVKHVIDSNLAEPDQKKRYDEGTIDIKELKRTFRKQSIRAANDLQKGLCSSFLYILTLTILSVFVAYTKGVIDPSLTINYSKLITYIGVYLASWATLMELGGSFRSWDGGALHELIHPRMFKILFIPGVGLMLYGVLV
tara:strand:+ start:418 stop:915 length:498 start_codon:yes stop_codon:yes gene_type:complete